MPTTPTEFSKSLVDCGLIEENDLQTFLYGLVADKTCLSVEELARELIRAGKLTRFQAQAIYQGKTNGLVLGNYVVLDKLGQGGMGTVYKAHHRRMDRVVALKLLPRSAKRSPDLVKRFQQEVRAAAKLSHPNIVTSHDADEERGSYFLVMEYVEGRDLAKLVAADGVLTIEKAVDCIAQVARGLEYAHMQGVIHRDIKPSNLLLDKRGIVKILDMGLARTEQMFGSSDSGLTQSGQVMGTVDYMAPEQAMDTKSADSRADIYSLGCTLWYLLVGRPVYSGGTTMQKILLHQKSDVPSICDERTDVPLDLDNIFRKMLAKAPEQRFQNMTEVIAALQAVPEVPAGSIRTPSKTDSSTMSYIPRHNESVLSPETTMGVRPNVDTETVLQESSAHKRPESEATETTKLHKVDGWVDDPLLPSMIQQPALIPKLESMSRQKGNTTFWSGLTLSRYVVFTLLGLAFSGLLLAATIVFRTADGTLVVELSETDVEVEVFSEDGRLEITRKGDTELEISIDPGKHRLRLLREGTEVFAKEFAIASGGREVIVAKFLPNDNAPIPLLSSGDSTTLDAGENKLLAISAKSKQNNVQPKMGYSISDELLPKELAEVRVNFNGDIPNAKIIIDNEEYSPTELSEYVRLKVGTHKLVVESLGQEIQSQTFDLAPGEKKVLSLEPKFSAKLIEEFDGDIIQETNNKLLKCGRTKGIQYYESSEPGNGWFAWNYSDFSESIVEVTARIPIDYKNAWILNLADGQNSHGTAIAIFGDGKAWIGPNVFDPQPPANQLQKFITHAAIQPAGEWNTLRVLPKGRSLVVHCNSEEILNIADLGFEINSGSLGLGYSANEGKSRVEFDRYVLWATTDISLTPTSTAPSR